MYQTELNNITLFNAPEEYDYDNWGGINPEKVIKIFLAGGITGCRNWQDDCLKELDYICHNKNVWVYNPRRQFFNLSDPNAATEQIAWEFKHLEEMDIFSMYFCASETSVGPICLYELGRYLCRMQMRFPKDWMERTVISIEDGYSRLRDVCMQLELAAPKLGVLYRASPSRHAERIVRSIRDVKYGSH